MRKALGYIGGVLGWVIVVCFLIATLAGAIQNNKGNSTIENIKEMPATKEPVSKTTAEEQTKKSTKTNNNTKGTTQKETTSTDPRDNAAYQARIQNQQEEALNTDTPGEAVTETRSDGIADDNKGITYYEEPELPRTVTGLVVNTNGYVLVGSEYAGREGNFTLS